MHEIFSLEARIQRIENNQEADRQAIAAALENSRRFATKLSVFISAATALVLAVGFLYIARHWLAIAGWWPEFMALPVALFSFAGMRSWLESWQSRDLARLPEGSI